MQHQINLHILKVLKWCIDLQRRRRQIQQKTPDSETQSETFGILKCYTTDIHNQLESVAKFRSSKYS